MWIYLTPIFRAGVTLEGCLPRWSGQAGQIAGNTRVGHMVLARQTEECQNWLLKALAIWTGGQQEKWCLPTLLFLKKSADFCPSCAYPKISRKFPLCIYQVVLKLLLLCCVVIEYTSSLRVGLGFLIVFHFFELSLLIFSSQSVAQPILKARHNGDLSFQCRCPGMVVLGVSLILSPLCACDDPLICAQSQLEVQLCLHLLPIYSF